MTRISWRFSRVWQRNFLVYRRTLLVGFMPPLLEPLFYLLAFGVGMGLLIGHVHYEGRDMTCTLF